MLATLLKTVGFLFCHHEWVTRAESNRLYLECLRCLSTTEGIRITRRGHVPIPAACAVVAVHPAKLPAPGRAAA